MRDVVYSLLRRSVSEIMKKIKSFGLQLHHFKMLLKVNTKKIIKRLWSPYINRKAVLDEQPLLQEGNVGSGLSLMDEIWPPMYNYKETAL